MNEKTVGGCMGLGDSYANSVQYNSKECGRDSVLLQRIFRVGGVCTTGAMLLLALAPVGMCQTASVQKEEPAP